MIKKLGVTLFLLFFPLWVFAAGDSEHPLQNTYVVIDPGHNSRYNHAVAVDNTPEHQLALDAALELERILEEQGATVDLTRRTDHTFDERGERYDVNARADYIREELFEPYHHTHPNDRFIFLCLHYNASDSHQGTGTEVYYRGDSDLAQNIVGEVADLGFRDRGTAVGNYRVMSILDRTDDPNGINFDIDRAYPEICFIDNQQDYDLFNQLGLQQIGEAIRDGVINHITISAQVTIAPQSPVREGAINVNMTTSDDMPQAPNLAYIDAIGGLHIVVLQGAGRNWQGIATIPKGSDGLARFSAFDPRCNNTIEITPGGTFYIDTEEPEVTATTPANGEVIIAEEVPKQVNISATLYDPPINGYASGIDYSTVVLTTPQGTFKQASAVNKLDYGEYACSIVAKDNANEPG